MERVLVNEERLQEQQESQRTTRNKHHLSVIQIFVMISRKLHRFRARGLRMHKVIHYSGDLTFLFHSLTRHNSVSWVTYFSTTHFIHSTKYPFLYIAHLQSPVEKQPAKSPNSEWYLYKLAARPGYICFPSITQNNSWNALASPRPLTAVHRWENIKIIVLHTV